MFYPLISSLPAYISSNHFVFGAESAIAETDARTVTTPALGKKFTEGSTRRLFGEPNTNPASIFGVTIDYSALR